MPDSQIEAWEITFSGLVQGVGFRQTSFEIARTHPEVAGWVRNEWDGKVQMHIQGTRTAMDAYLHEIARESRLARLIQQMNKKTGTVIDGMTGFRIER